MDWNFTYFQYDLRMIRNTPYAAVRQVDGAAGHAVLVVLTEPFSSDVARHRIEGGSLR
jgi:hypothetical protein